MENVYYTPEETRQQDLFSLVDNVKPDRTPEDLLFQVMLDLGVLLSSPIEVKEIAGKKVFNVADGFLLACFDHDVTEETVKAIAQMKPYYAVFRDSSMANDSVATNFDQIFETYSPETVRRRFYELGNRNEEVGMKGNNSSLLVPNFSFPEGEC